MAENRRCEKHAIRGGRTDGKADAITRETKMSSVRGSAHSKFYAGLLPIEPSDEFVRPATLENGPLPRRNPLRKRAWRALTGFLMAFFTGVAAGLAWHSYGDATRQMIANSYLQLGGLAPGRAPSAQNAPDRVALAASAAPYLDQQQLDAMLRDLHALRQSVEQIAASQEQITRSIDQIVASISAGQDLTHGTDQTATSFAQLPSADAARMTVESRADGAALQPAVRLDTKPTEAGLPQASSEKGKQHAAATGHDTSCFPSASAVLQNHRGGWPAWTLKVPGHEGTVCWYASARPRTRDHRAQAVQKKEIAGTTENELSARPPPYTRAPE